MAKIEINIIFGFFGRLINKRPKAVTRRQIRYGMYTLQAPEVVTALQLERLVRRRAVDQREEGGRRRRFRRGVCACFCRRPVLLVVGQVDDGNGNGDVPGSVGVEAA